MVGKKGQKEGKGTVRRVYTPWFRLTTFGATDIRVLGASQLSDLEQTML